MNNFSLSHVRDIIKVLFSMYIVPCHQELWGCMMPSQTDMGMGFMFFKLFSRTFTKYSNFCSSFVASYTWFIYIFLFIIHYICLFQFSAIYIYILYKFLFFELYYMVTILSLLNSRKFPFPSNFHGLNSNFFVTFTIIFFFLILLHLYNMLVISYLPSLRNSLEFVLLLRKIVYGLLKVSW